MRSKARLYKASPITSLCWPLFRLPFRLIFPRVFPMWEDPWQRRDLATLTRGASLRPFPEAEYFASYLRRRSSVTMDSLDDICKWLNECRYDRWAYSLNEAWPVPRDFERDRSGNCFDHALWGWRKLIELDVPSLVVFGQVLDGKSLSYGHAWAQFEFEGKTYLFETTAKGAGYPWACYLSDAQSLYRPWYSVDSELRRHEYYGYWHSQLYDPVL
jgi:hypothetical protein